MIKEFKHTPGPWVATVDEDGDNLSVRAESLPIVAGCGCCGSPWTAKANAKANASLIAAAPDLLEALELARPFVAESIPAMFGDGPLAKIDAALAKARGE